MQTVLNILLRIGGIKSPKMCVGDTLEGRK